MANLTGVKDTSKINYTIDGNINEWKTDKFETDKETQVLYAIDHDANNLYVAMKITDPRTQMKMMIQGMNMYIDKKGKKREGTGIEFPIKQAKGMGNFGARGGGRTGAPPPTDPAAAPQTPDPKAMRENLALNMILLKTFGFDDQEDKMQIIDQPGAVNIAFDWNDANEMFIEYQVPMGFLGKPSDLNGKLLGIGWKINGITMEGGGSSSTSFSRPGGTGSSGRGSRSGANSNIPASTTDFPSGGSDSRFKEQSIWTKYTLTF